MAMIVSNPVYSNTELIARASQSLLDHLVLATPKLDIERNPVTNAADRIAKSYLGNIKSHELYPEIRIEDGLFGKWYEELEKDLIKPIKNSVMFANPDMTNFGTWRPAIYTKKIPIEDQNSIFENYRYNQFNYSVENAEEVAKLTAAETNRFYVSRQEYLGNVKKNLVDRCVKKVTDVFDTTKTEVFDPTKAYNQTIQYTEDSEVKEKLAYVRKGVVSGEEKFGVIVKNIAANQYVSFDKAVEDQAIIILNEMIKLIKNPVEGADEDEKYQNLVNFVRAFEIWLSKGKFLKEGRTLTGSPRIIEKEKLHMYILTGILPQIKTILPQVFNPTFLAEDPKGNKLFNGISVTEVENFGDYTNNQNVYCVICEPDSMRLIRTFYKSWVKDEPKQRLTERGFSEDFSYWFILNKPILVFKTPDSDTIKKDERLDLKNKTSKKK